MVTRESLFRSISLRIAVALWSASALSQPVAALDWPHWRGPDYNGISKETAWTTQWPKEGPKQLWNANVGTGYASVAVARGHAYTAGNKANIDTLYCFDAENGKVLWKYSYPADILAKYNEGGTSSTPTVDGDTVYQLGKQGQLFRLNAADGSVAWQKNLVEELGAAINEWGFAGSVVVDGDLLILNIGSAGTAVEKATGKVVWTSGKEKAGYSSMVPLKVNGASCVAFMSAKALVIVETKTGKEVVPRVPWETGYDTICADPIIDGDSFFISSYDRGGAVSRLVDGKLKPVWKDWTMHNHINSSVLIDGFLYGINGQAMKAGDLRCVDFKTGEAKWVQPGIGIGSLIAANGKLIVLSEKGELIVAEANSEAFKPVARAQVLGGRCWTSPVLANGRIYCRNSRGDLVCVDVSGK